MKLTAASVHKALRTCARKDKIAIYQRFFKTGPGEYGEGDVFMGVTTPDSRRIAREYRSLPLSEIAVLLSSRIHEERAMALQILVLQFKKADEKARKQIYSFYVRHAVHINNWDLVDCSTPHIVGQFLLGKDHSVLYRWARSRNIWVRRMAIMATFTFLRESYFTDTFAIADVLLHDDHDLIHKAVGWMLREVGKRDLSAEEAFLKPRYATMPRTMLRYAIEKFPETKRKRYLKGLI